MCLQNVPGMQRGGTVLVRLQSTKCYPAATKLLSCLLSEEARELAFSVNIPCLCLVLSYGFSQ